MTTARRPPHHPDNEAHDDTLATVFRDVPPRPRVSVEDEARIRAALDKEWQVLSRRRRNRRRVVGFAMAASVLLAVLVGGFLMQSPVTGGVDAGVTFASVERVRGEVQVDRMAVTSGALLTDGQTVLTGPRSGVALTLEGGASLRAAAQTEFRIGAGNVVRLLAGRVYFDTGIAGTAPNLTIHTPVGTVRHVGTQYLVAIAAQGIDLAVREGSVEVAGAGFDLRARAGEGVVMNASGVLATRRVSSYGLEWQWTQDLAPPFSSGDGVAHGSRIDEFLRWVERESGRRLTYTSEQARRIAASEALLGATGHISLTPLSALDLMLRASTLEAEVDESEIRVRVRR